MTEKTPFDYFNQALTKFRLQADNFVKTYPNSANNLRLGPQVMEDPHISRLIEAIAFMQGQTQAQLEDNFSQVTQGLLHSLFPEHNAPLASMSIVNFLPSENLTNSVIIPKGCLLESAPIETEPCYFQVGYETELIPANITDVSIQQLPTSSVAITISTFDNAMRFSVLKPKTIRVYIEADPSLTNTFLDSLFRSEYTIALQSETQDIQLTKDILTPVGFNNSQQLLPLLSIQQQPYANLMEFIHYTEKFNFFDLCIPESFVEKCGNQMRIVFHFKEKISNLLLELNRKNLKLNCAPIINLFEKYLEPLEINHQQAIYPINIDKRHPKHFQLHYLSQVKTAVNNIAIANHFTLRNQNSTEFTFYMRRLGTPIKDSPDINQCGLEISNCKEMLSMTPITLELKGWCSNGDLPSKIIWPSSSNPLQVNEMALPIEAITCLTQPTIYTTNHLTHNKLNKVLALLQQQQMGLLNPAHAKESLINLILLYVTKQSNINHNLADAIQDVIVKPTKRYLADKIGNPLQFGFSIHIILNSINMPFYSLWLIINILKNCYTYHTPLNQFIELSVEVEDA